MNVAAPQAVSPAEIALAYHGRTKHNLKRYAAGPETLDWDTQPNPFREFAGAPSKSQVMETMVRLGHKDRRRYGGNGQNIEVAQVVAQQQAALGNVPENLGGVVKNLQMPARGTA